MTTTRLYAVWRQARGQLRRRWRSWVALAVLVGLAGGFVIASAAGSRRTSTVYDRLLAGADPFDVLVGRGTCEGGDDPAACRVATRRSLDEALAMPEVVDGVKATGALVPIGKTQEPSSASIQPSGETCFTGPGEVDVVGSDDGRLGRDINRYHYVAGRAADPTRPDEVVISAVTARRAGIEVGDRLNIVPIDACADVEPNEWPPPIVVSVVGITLAPGEVQPATGQFFQSVTVSPAVLDKLLAAGLGSVYGVLRLREGVTVEAFTAAMTQRELPLEPMFVSGKNRGSVSFGLGPDATALALLAVLGGLAALVVLAQAIVRQVWIDAPERTTLRALGFTTRDLAAVGAVQGLATGVTGMVVAVVFAVVTSPLTPIGRARAIETNPGLRIDALVFGLGAVILLVVTIALVTMASAWVAVRATKSRTTSGRAVSRWGAVCEALPPTVACGTRMALDPGRGATAVPIRSGLAGMVVGIAALTGAMTFTGGLDHLLVTPRLVGLNWDVTFFGGYQPPEGTQDADVLEAFLHSVDRAEHVPGVERMGYGTFWPPSDVPLIDGIETWLVSFSTGPRAIQPTIITGRAPVGADELMVSAAVLDKLGRRIGDTVVVHGAILAEGVEPKPTSSTVEIVGVGVVPVLGGLDKGVALTFEGLQRLYPQAGPGIAFSLLSEGADRARAIEDLEGLGFLRDSSPFDLAPVDTLNLDVREADLVPRLLGALMAVLGAAVLTHLVLTGVRARRNELATLRALGFTSRQVRATLAWGATTVTVLTLLVALPLGIIAGRAAWEAYARRIDIVPESVSPWWPLALVAGVAVVLANVVALAAARTGSRRSPAAALRAE
ncbi:MAG: FtsX-like permease family protein [Acidimicrobiales bacterium]